MVYTTPKRLSFNQSYTELQETAWRLIWPDVRRCYRRCQESDETKKMKIADFEKGKMS